MMRLSPRDATPRNASDSIDDAYPPLNGKHAVFDARKRSRSDTVSATSKRARVTPESSEKDEAKGGDKGGKSKRHCESDKKRSKDHGPAQATVAKILPATGAFKPSPASRQNRVSFQAPSVPSPKVEKSVNSRKKEDTQVSTLKIDANFSDDTDKESEGGEDTENDGEDSDEEMSQSSSFSDEGTSQLTSLSDDTSDMSHSAMDDFWERIHGECDCRSCRWNRDGFDSEDDVIDDDEAPRPMPNKLSTAHAARLVAHQHQTKVSPLSIPNESSPASSSTLQEMSPERSVADKAGGTGMDIDTDGHPEGAKRKDTEKDAEEAQNANGHVVNKGKGKKDPAYGFGTVGRGTNDGVRPAVNIKLAPIMIADDIAAVAKESVASSKSAGKANAPESAETMVPDAPTEAGMPKEMMQLLTALVQQECAKAIPKVSGIDDLSDQITGVFSEVHKVFHMMDENLSETYQLHRKVKTMEQSLACLQESIDNAEDTLESIQEDLAKYKRRRTSTGPSPENKDKADSSQLKHLDNAVLSIEAKLSALGMFLTGKVVRDVASVEENGLKKLFDRVTEDIATNSGLIEKVIEDVNGLSHAVGHVEDHVEEMEREVGSSGDVDFTLHGRLTSIESRLEANFKY